MVTQKGQVCIDDQLHMTHFGQYQVNAGGAFCQIRSEQALFHVKGLHAALLQRSL